jgi:hypothetical protein
MAYIVRELSDIIEVSDLSWRVPVGCGSSGVNEWFMVRKDGKMPAFQHVSEVADSEVDA